MIHRGDAENAEKNELCALNSGADVIMTNDQSRLPLVLVIAAALLCGGLTALCGVSHSALAVAFGGLLAVTIALPPLAVASDRWLAAIWVSVASVCAVIVVWLSLSVTWSQWWDCVLVVVSFAFALAGGAMALRVMRVPAIVSAAVVVIVSLAWLSWPVWLSRWLVGHQMLVNALVAGHPLLAINGTLIDQGIWTERPRMYGWTALNQDVSFAMPTSVLWCVILHAGVGLVCVTALGATATMKRQRSAQRSQRHREHGEKGEPSE
jgi:hypothetical protein